MSLNSSAVLAKILLLLSTRSKLCGGRAGEALVCLYSAVQPPLPPLVSPPCPLPEEQKGCSSSKSLR